jgi:hypothetical protein
MPGRWHRCSPAAATVAIDPGVFRGVLPLPAFVL